MLKRLEKDIDFYKLCIAICFLIFYLVILPNIISYGLSLFHFDLTNYGVVIIANLLIYLIPFGLLLFWYRKTLGKELKEFFKNFRSYGKVSFTYWLLGLFFMAISNSIILSINGALAANEVGNREIFGAFPVFAVITMALLGPFLEEMLFRKNFREAFKNKTLFLVVSSLVFGSVHLLASITTDFQWTQLLFIIPYGGFGYFFGKAYLETNNIFTSVFAHILHNTLSVLIVLLGA